ncbi:MAG: hypothetical protein ACQEWV_12370 [Bacillota bacterium]
MAVKLDLMEEKREAMEDKSLGMVEISKICSITSFNEEKKRNNERKMGLQ